MKAFYADHFVLPLPAGHRFPMAKYGMLRARLLAEGVLTPAELEVPRAATDAELMRVHTPDYVRRVAGGRLTAPEVRRIGFPWSAAMVERSRRSAGATLMACRAALRDRVAVNLAGGTHHAFADRGEGYCVFNDAAVAARACQAEGLADRVLVVDLDVHQGNGTARIFADDPTVFTLSLHGAHNFPFHKERGDCDVELPDGADDATYLAALVAALPRAIAAAAADVAIYLAGADPFVGDCLGRLGLSKAGLAERDQLVLAACDRANLPVAIAMAGGYAACLDDIVDIHVATVREARLWANG